VATCNSLKAMAVAYGVNADEPTREYNTTCPFCSYRVTVVRDRYIHESEASGRSWWSWRGACRGCSRVITVSVDPRSVAQRAYGRSWWKFWRQQP
jgi:hypothetical protein